MDSAASNERTLAIRNQTLTFYSIGLSMLTIILGFAFTSMTSSYIPSTMFSFFGIPIGTLGIAGSQFMNIKALEWTWRLTFPRIALSAIGIVANLTLYSTVMDFVTGVLLTAATVTLTADTILMIFASYYAYQLSTQLQIIQNSKWLLGGVTSTSGKAETEGFVRSRPN
eukprot:PhF_6_TR41744/c0_g1_i2/m.63355